MTARLPKAACLAVAAASALALAGCGASSLESASGPSSDAPGGAKITLTSQPAPDSDPAADVINGIKPDKALAAKVPTDIRDKGIHFSSSVGYPPMEVWAKDGKTQIGVDPSLGRAIARVLGVGIKMSDEDFNAQIPGLITGRYDMVMSSMTDSKEREKKVTFVDYVQAGAGFLVKKGNPEGITKPADMCGKTVSVVDNGSSLAFTEGYSKDCTKAGKPEINILRMTGDQEALLALKSGRAQVNLTDWVVAASEAADPKHKIDAIQLPGTESPWGIAMNPDNTEFISAVQGALGKLITSGEYGKILAAYNMQGLATKSATINKAIS